MTAPDPIEPAPGPRWSRKRLTDMLLDCYGPAERGGVDVAAVADYAGVTESTVRRWISGGQREARRLTPAPAERIAQLQRGPDLVEQANRQQYDYAVTARAAVREDRGILPAWRKQGWLNEHTVLIVAINGKPWHQVVVTKATPRALSELRRRATIVDSIVVPTRFDGQLLAHMVMARQQNWRVHPLAEQLPIGRTQVWMQDAPAVELAALARKLK